MTEINGESTSMVWPTFRSRAAKEQNRTYIYLANCYTLVTYKREDSLQESPALRE